jgi:hypothetical protein
MITGNPERKTVAVPLKELNGQLSSLRSLIADVTALAREFRARPPLMVDLRNSATNLS